MRTASFFLLSAALHAAALAYPALLKTQATAPIAVTLVESGEQGGGGGSGGEKSPAAEKPGGTQVKKKTAAPQPTTRAAAEAPAQREVAALAPPVEPIALPVVSNEANGAREIPARSGDAVVVAPLGSASRGTSESDGASGANGAGSGPGSGAGAGSASGRGSGAGSGSGSGSGAGDGDGSGAAPFVQANYLVCPKADYPEAARREGREGKVTLLVLVDEEGRPKSSRVLESSGVASLDRAALDNIQRRCRFQPARRGDRHVETSIKVPVEFRLADSKAREARR
jgi:periplasmic protein TonB